MTRYSRQMRTRSWLKDGSKRLGAYLLSASLLAFSQQSSALEHEVSEPVQDQTLVPQIELVAETSQVVETPVRETPSVVVDQVIVPAQELEAPDLKLSASSDSLEPAETIEPSQLDTAKIEVESQSLSLEKAESSLAVETVANGETTTVLPQQGDKDNQVETTVSDVNLPSMDAGELLQILDGQGFLPERLDPDLFQQTLVIQGQAITEGTIPLVTDEAQSLDLGDGSELYIRNPLGKFLSDPRPVADQDSLYRLDILTKRLLDVYKVFYQVKELSPADKTDLGLETSDLPINDGPNDTESSQEVDLATDEQATQETSEQESPQEELTPEEAIVSVTIEETEKPLADGIQESTTSQLKEEVALEQASGGSTESSIVTQVETVGELISVQEDKDKEERTDSTHVSQLDETEFVDASNSQREGTLVSSDQSFDSVAVTGRSLTLWERLISGTSQFLVDLVRETTATLSPTPTSRNSSSEPSASPSSPRVLPFFPKAVARLDESGDLYLAPPTMARQLTLAYDNQGVTLRKTEDDDWQGSGIDFTYDKESGYLIIPQESLPSNTQLTIQSTDETGRVLDEQVYDIVDEPRPPHILVWSQSLLIQPTADVKEFLVEYKDDSGQYRRVQVLKDKSGKWIADNNQFVADNDGTLLLPLKQLRDDSDITVYTQNFDYVWSRLELAKPEEKDPVKPDSLSPKKGIAKRRLTLQK